MAEPTRKVAIVGAGAVGSAAAYACMIRRTATRIVMHDNDALRLEAEVLDLSHGLQFVPMATIEGSPDPEICRDAGVVVITAGARQRPGQTRLDLAGANATICRQLLPRVVRVAPDAVYLVVTNPVDVITYGVLRLTGLPPARVMGSGTVLDSSRLRHLIGRHCRVAVQNVHAYIVGEHGDSEIPLWTSATIAGIPLDAWSVPGHGSLGEKERAAIFESVRGAAYRIIEGKGATSYAIGLATARIVEAILNDEGRVLPVSSRLDGYLGLREVCLSVPCVVNRAGVDTTLLVPMSGEEQAGLRASAETIRRAIVSLGF